MGRTPFFCNFAERAMTTPQNNDLSSNFPSLALPPAPLRLRRGNGAIEVFDELRRKWLVLTPEEWVRQHFVAFLRGSCGFPGALMANEYSIDLNGMLRRCDTVVFDRRLRPLVICEYKAPSVAITQKVFDQIARYNIVLTAPYLMVSNGLRHYCVRFEGTGYVFLDHIPAYSELQ